MAAAKTKSSPSKRSAATPARAKRVATKAVTKTAGAQRQEALAAAAYLEAAIERYSPEVAGTARVALRKLHACFPGARLLVYERKNLLPIGFAPPERGSALFSIVLYPRWVRFFFLEGIALQDPERRLEGDGSQVRSLKLDAGAAVLDDPYVAALIEQAVEIGEADFTLGRGEVVIKSKVDW